MTSLIRSWSPRLLLIAMGLLATVGCSTQEKLVYDPVNTTPIVGDDAMALRANWPRSVSTYQNGDVAAYSTRYPYQGHESRADTANVVLDTITFVGETAFLPIELIVNPPYQKQIWYGAKFAPTYTAQPPLPPVGGGPAGDAHLYSR